MADTGFLLPQTAVNDATVGTTDWTSPTEALTDNATNAYVSLHTVSAHTENSIKLVIAGSVAGNDKSTGAAVGSTDKTYGGSTDLWGLTPTVAQINDSGFGFAYSVTGTLGTSKYLKVTNFGFNIPTRATIDGIEVFSNQTQNTATVKIDYISIKVYYHFADTGFKFPGTAVNDATVGTINWVEVIGTGDTLIQSVSADGGGMLHPTGVRLSGGVTDTTARLFIGGVPAGDNKALGTTFSTEIRTYGNSTSDKWGLTPTAAQINASDFGFGISITGNGGTSKYLYVSNFGFSIPAGAQIDGIQVKTDWENPAGAPRVDYIQIIVYYTEKIGPFPTHAV